MSSAVIIGERAFADVLPREAYDETCSLLRQLGAVDEFDLGSTHKCYELGHVLQLRRYDRLLLWGVGREAEQSLRDMHPRTTIVPSRAFMEQDDRWLRSFLGKRFLAFDRGTHERLLDNGLESHFFQWYSNPVDNSLRLDVGTDQKVLWIDFPDRSPQDLELITRQCVRIGASALTVCSTEATEGSTELAEIARRLLVDKVSVSCVPLDGRKKVIEQVIAQHSFVIPTGSIADCRWAVTTSMGYGRIALVSAVPALKDYVGHRSSGLIYDPMDSLELSILSTLEARRISRGAAAKAERGYKVWRSDQRRLRSLLHFDGQRWESSDWGGQFATRIRRSAFETAFAWSRSNRH